MSTLKSKNIKDQNSNASELPFLMRELHSHNDGAVLLNIFDLNPSPPEFNFYRKFSKDKLDELAISISTYGLLHPIVVWQKEDGIKQVLSGHNRLDAYKLLYNSTKDQKYLSILALIKKDLNEDSAKEIIIDSNWVGRTLSTLERTRSIYFKYVLLGRKKRSQPNDSGYKRNYDIIAEDYNLSGKQIQRYIKLNKLINPLLQLIDNKALTLRSGLKLADFDENTQQEIYEIVKDNCNNKSIATIDNSMDLNTIKAILSNKSLNETVSVSFNVPKNVKKEFVKAALEWLQQANPAPFTDK